MLTYIDECWLKDALKDTNGKILIEDVNREIFLLRDILVI